MIDGSTCTVSSVGNTQIECVTGPHMGSYSAKVEVEVGGNGIAQEVGSFTIIIWASMGENLSLGFNSLCCSHTYVNMLGNGLTNCINVSAPLNRRVAKAPDKKSLKHIS